MDSSQRIFRSRYLLLEPYIISNITNTTDTLYCPNFQFSPSLLCLAKKISQNTTRPKTTPTIAYMGVKQLR